MSSTSVVVKCLESYRMNGTAFGQITIGTLILQDCSVGIMFALMPALGAAAASNAAGPAAAAAAAAAGGHSALFGALLLLAKVLAKLLLLVAAAAAVAILVLPAMLHLLLRCVVFMCGSGWLAWGRTQLSKCWS
jgi:Kef-type K+ transport system membrane component KefB